MFKALLVKELREKALIAAFGLGLMVVFLAAFLIYGNSLDFRDFIPAGFLIVFFPFLGLMLGAAAFESEFRNSSWAYLLSRPVRKETIWLAKLSALLSVLAGFWLIFAGLMAVVPRLGEVVSGYRLSELLEPGLAFFPLILLSSLFYFSVAFSLSLLSERQFGLVFGSLFLGLIVQGVLSYFAFQAGGRGLMSHAGRFPGLEAFKLALVLSSLAFLGASLLTFLKADFSQPKKKARSLTTYSVLFLALAWLLSAAWPTVRPGPREEIESVIDGPSGETFFCTTKGLYRYSVTGAGMRKIVRWHDTRAAVVGGDKVLYADGWDLPEGPSLRVVNGDGSGKRILAGGAGRSDPPAFMWIEDFTLSPDGKTAVFVFEQVDEMSPRSAKKSIASVRTDGSGLTGLPNLNPELAGDAKGHSWVRIVAWLESPDRLLLRGQNQTGATSLWLYDLTSGVQSRLFDNPRPGLYVPAPRGNAVLLLSRKDVADPVDVSLLDPAKGETASVMTVVSPGSTIWSSVRSPVWSRNGDKVAFLVQRDGGFLTPAVYLLKEHRLVMPDDVRVQGSPAPFSSLGWTAGGLRLVLTIPGERSLRILGPDLSVRTTMAVPGSIGADFYAWPVDDAIFVLDFTKEAIWRLDLKTEKWRKIW